MLFANGPDFVRLQAEDEDVLRADLIADFDIGAIQRPDGKRAVQRELHIAGTGGFFSRGRDLFAEIGGRNDPLCQRHTIVRDERDLDPVIGALIVVDNGTNVVDQFDDLLGEPVTRRGLATEDISSRDDGFRPSSVSSRYS